MATIGILMSIPGQTMGVSVFTDPLLAATGLTRLELSTTYLLGTLASSLLLPRGGSFLDRYGARAAAMASAAMMGLTLIAFMQIDVAASALARLAGGERRTWAAAVFLTLAFTLLRFSGQGMLTMASRTMTAKWFDRRRGLATGIAGVFVAFGFAIAPWALQGLIELTDWRRAYLCLAVVVGVGMPALAWGFYRDNPEQCGLRMDGDQKIAEEGRSSTPAVMGFSRGAALRTRRFWSVTLPLAIQAMGYTGVTFHIIDIGRETGVGGVRAVEFFLPIAAVSTTVGLLSGWAADRIEVRNLVLALLAGQILGFVGAGRLGEPFFAALMVGGWGAASGLYGTLAGVAVAHLFGRLHLGAISSLQMSCIVAASAVGPALLAATKDFLGSYRAGLLLCCGLSAAAFALALLTPTPRLSRSGTRAGGG